ncbi:MAG: hypothetical protein AVDCRST_MAG89-4437, partial [uncultured Gemmatimonadetes bacterium]
VRNDRFRRNHRRHGVRISAEPQLRAAPAGLRGRRPQRARPHSRGRRGVHRRHPGGRHPAAGGRRHGAAVRCRRGRGRGRGGPRHAASAHRRL